MQLVRAWRRVLIVDGGRPRNRFAQTSHGFFGQDGKAPDVILAEARRQVLAYPTAACRQDEVLDSHPIEGGFRVDLASGEQVHARRVILATGVTDILPDLPGLKERWGRSVLHCPYCHGYEMRDRPLGVLASHPMSAHKALMIPDWGPTTLFIQSPFEMEPELQAMLMARGVTIERRPIVALLGEIPGLRSVQLVDGQVVPIEALFVAPATRMASPLAAQLGCAFDDGVLGPVIRTDDWKATSVPGVFAAGDAARAMHNATLASADGVLAGVGTHQSLVRDLEASDQQRVQR
jgi:thioredoxin reductase